MDTDKELSQPETNSDEELRVCPFLRWKNDETIRYGFSQVANFCYKPKKPRPVRLTYQDDVCLSGKFSGCSVFQQEKISQLPYKIRGKNISKRSSFIKLFLIIIAIFIILGVITLIFIIRNSQLIPITNSDSISSPEQNFIINSNEFEIRRNTFKGESPSSFPFYVPQNGLNSVTNFYSINDSTYYPEVTTKSDKNIRSLNSDIKGNYFFSGNTPYNTLGSESSQFPTYLFFP